MKYKPIDKRKAQPWGMGLTWKIKNDYNKLIYEPL